MSITDNDPRPFQSSTPLFLSPHYSAAASKKGEENNSNMSVYVVGPAEERHHSHTVILLHGRDSEAEEFASEFFECEVTGTQADRTLPSQFPTIRWVFPQAKMLASERFDTEMSQWFDMWSVEEPQHRPEIQTPGLLSSVNTFTQLVKDEEQLVSRDRIFLGGISQGFATALATFLADGRGGFAGLCGFCSWLPLADATQAALNKPGHPDSLAAVHQLYRGQVSDKTLPLPMTFCTTQILLQHCRDDSVIPIKNGLHMRQMLEEDLKFSRVEWHDYEDGGHWINEPQGVDDFAGFLQRAMSAVAVSSALS